MKKIILASGSPRRREILEQAAIPFETVVSDADEESGTDGLSPFDLVSLLSKRKALAVSAHMKIPCIIIAADTVVSLRGKILGKPRDHADACAMLKLLQGHTHCVYTGVTLIDKNADGETVAETFAETTGVTMRSLSDAEILSYVDTGEPFDKAGSYAIQGKGVLLVESIEGDYYNVV
ncbi:MAG: Maf family protein, partial [Clostridiales bacterium]|nr:Maf family protein [Clostridiales bacterium]